MNTKRIGDYGEKYASSYISKHGYRIVERNYKRKCGEIDIIAYDGDCLCFIEVKTRSRTDYGKAWEAVDRRKREKIIRTSAWYLAEHNVNAPIRFDVIEVYLEEKMFTFSTKINVIKNAFDANAHS